MSDIIRTPWTEEQVKVLNEYQANGSFHPYTCGKRDNHNNNDMLIATRDGWVCPFPGCDYTQKWAHNPQLFEPQPRNYPDQVAFEKAVDRYNEYLADLQGEE